MLMEKLAHYRGRTENPDPACRRLSFFPDKFGGNILNTLTTMLCGWALADKKKAQNHACSDPKCKDARIALEDADDRLMYLTNQGPWERLHLLSDGPSEGEKKYEPKKRRRRGRRGGGITT